MQRICLLASCHVSTLAALDLAATPFQEFALEMVKAREGKTKNTPWGSSFKQVRGQKALLCKKRPTCQARGNITQLECPILLEQAPEILHGYTKKVKGKTAEERLDMRAAMKSDKFCR